MAARVRFGSSAQAASVTCEARRASRPSNAHAQRQKHVLEYFRSRSRLIRVFLAVVDARGITAAEASLGVRQSTISAAVGARSARRLQLCDRGRGGFRLTSKGERFAATARTLVAATSEFVARVRDIDRKLVGTLSIGLIGKAPLVENARVADAIGAFRKRNKAVTFAMKVASPQELERASSTTSSISRSAISGIACRGCSTRRCSPSSR